MAGGGGGRSRRRARALPLLPSSTSNRSSSSFSFWYCDIKIYTFNDFLFNIGSRYSSFLKVWFSFGACYGLIALLGISMILILDSASTFLFQHRSSWLDNVFTYGRSISVMDLVFLIVSTLFSIAFHEFGHAIAAASEGIQIEYIAIFLAVLFPGALVALDNDLLQNLPSFSSLRIYCAGIWHNLVLCAVCALAIFILPLLLYPFYTHGEGLIVLGVPKSSALTGYLSPHDVILSVDGSKITSTDDLIKLISQYKEEKTLKKGYCVPNSWIDASNGLHLMGANREMTCPDEFSPFVTLNCRNSDPLFGNYNTSGINHCLIARDVARLGKCGDETDSCTCSQAESCVAPVQPWVEISYTSPYASKCVLSKKNSSPIYNGNLKSESDPDSSPCGGTFVYTGDLPYIAHFVHLSEYRPRSVLFMSYIPYVLEKALICTLRVSAALAAVNCLPVYFLDGESILETGIGCVTWLTRRKRHKVVRFCLLVGTFLTIISFSSILYSYSVVS